MFVEADKVQSNHPQLSVIRDHFTKLLSEIKDFLDKQRLTVIKNAATTTGD